MEYPQTARNTVRRSPARACYDRATVHQILDSGFLCHVGFVVDGQPYVIPTLYGRQDETLYLHGAPASRMLQQLSTGIHVCVSVTHVDGLVLARSAFHHSVNYRSVVAFGTATAATGADKEHGLFVISENVLKGRWQEVRPPNATELRITQVLQFQIESASAKIRSGPPHDDNADYELPVWAGVLPVATTLGKPENDPRLRPGIELPPSVTK